MSVNTNAHFIVVGAGSYPVHYLKFTSTIVLCPRSDRESMERNGEEGLGYSVVPPPPPPGVPGFRHIKL